MKQPKHAMEKKVATAPMPTALLEDLRRLIEETRQGMAVTVNAALTLLYWRVGKRINEEILKGERAEYGQRILQALSTKLTAEYGRGWGEKYLRHCLRFAETFPDEQIVSALRRQLIWTHLLLAGFYAKGILCRDIPSHLADAGSAHLYRRRRGCALTQSHQDTKEEIMKDNLSAFVSLRETILEMPIAENVAKLLEGE